MKEFKYTNSNKRYHTLDYYYKNKFNSKIAKVSLNAGFSCPHLDRGGCIYCSKSGSGEFGGNVSEDVVTQFNNIKKIMDNKWKNTKYIGYFQARTNTYASVDVLKKKYEPILKLPNVIGIAIATRPDSITDECLDYLDDLNKRTYLTVELGLQTIHNDTATLINRCHNLKCFEDMVNKLRERGIDVVVHIIDGLPYETKDMMLETVKYLNGLDIQGIKIHMLSVLKDTLLAKMYQDKPFKLLTMEEYIDIVCEQITYLRPEIVIHRLTGDPDPNELIAPLWTTNKISVLNGIDKKMAKENLYQGKNLKND